MTVFQTAVLCFFVAQLPDLPPPVTDPKEAPKKEETKVSPELPKVGPTMSLSETISVLDEADKQIGGIRGWYEAKRIDPDDARTRRDKALADVKTILASTDADGKSKLNTRAVKEIAEVKRYLVVISHHLDNHKRLECSDREGLIIFKQTLLMQLDTAEQLELMSRLQLQNPIVNPTPPPVEKKDEETKKTRKL